MIIKRNKPLYWVSENLDLDQKEINPGIPRNFLTQGKSIDGKTKRIQLFDSLDDAISVYSLGGKNLEGVVLGVYRPRHIEEDRKIEPGQSNTPYSEILSGNEYWCLIPLEMIKIADIKIDKKTGDKSFRSGSRSLKTAFVKEGKLGKYTWTEILPEWDKKGKTKKL